jgi:diaminopimelate decarboxylase
MKTEHISKLTKLALNNHAQDVKAFIVYDLDFLNQRFDELINSFPAQTLHGIAMKACPLPNIIKQQIAKGLGAECASIEEVYLALDAGMPTEKIIFDGPAKTHEEIAFCIQHNIYLNIDNFEELSRIKKLLPEKTAFQAGFRVNPQIGMGKISTTSVAGKRSKFGVNLNENSKRLIQAYQENSWLTGIHTHLGSQGMEINQLIQGIQHVLNFALEVPQIQRFDLGGGLSVRYTDHDHSYSFSDYSTLLNEKCPQLFSGKYKILTEFGRSIFANTAFAVSRIEYVKDDQLINHFGADMFLRPVYRAEDWKHEFLSLSSNGEILNTPFSEYQIAGPLCFGGDYIGQNQSLNSVQSQDLLVIKDVGAYTLSMWSRHCSRFTPLVLGIKNDQVITIKEMETRSKLMSFWS